MKKVICKIIIIMVVIVIGFGLSNLIEIVTDSLKKNDNNHITNKIDDEINVNELEENGEIAKYTKVKNVNCKAFKNAIYANNKYFISNEDGKYIKYEYSIDKKFSNEENCNVIEELEKKPLFITDDTLFVKSEKNGKCYYNDIGMTKSTFIIYEDLSYALFSYPNEYCIKQEFDTSATDGSIIWDSSGNSTPYEWKELQWKKGVDRYQIKSLFEDDNNYAEYWDVKKHAITSTKREGDVPIILLELYISEDILKILDGIVVTDSKIYIPGVIDYSCKEYVDKECKKGYKENTDLTVKYENIVFVNRSYIVFEDGTTYMYGTY